MNKEIILTLQKFYIMSIILLLFNCLYFLV